MRSKYSSDTHIMHLKIEQNKARKPFMQMCNRLISLVGAIELLQESEDCPAPHQRFLKIILRRDGINLILLPESCLQLILDFEQFGIFEQYCNWFPFNMPDPVMSFYAFFVKIGKNFSELTRNRPRFKISLCFILKIRPDQKEILVIVPHEVSFTFDYRVNPTSLVTHFPRYFKQKMGLGLHLLNFSNRKMPVMTNPISPNAITAVSGLDTNSTT